MGAVDRVRALVSELRRRRVFRVAGAYLLAAWAVLQVATTIAPILRLPGWAPAFTLFALALGFPVALGLAWAYDVTPAGVKRAQPAASPDAQDAATGVAGPSAVPGAPGSRRRVSYLAAGALALLVAVAAWARLRPPEADGQRIRSVAVLPFVNMSGDQRNEYFSDGITEEILDALAKVPGLQVAARTSSFVFKGKAADLREVARQLGVGAVLEGSVQREGDRVRITAQLIDARTGYHIWSDRYDRDTRDVFATEDDISRTVADRLRVMLAGEPTPARRSSSAPAVSAHDHYLLGLAEWHAHTPGGEARAISHYRAAIAADPGYAQAYAGLAIAYAVLPTRAPGPTPLAVGDTAEMLARRASALDSSLSAPHDALGMIAYTMRWDFARAGREFSEAIRLNPNDATAYSWNAYLLQILGRDRDALAAADRAVALDPLSPSLSYGRAITLYHARRYAEAEAELRRLSRSDDAAALAAASPSGPFLRGRIFLLSRQYDSANTELREWARDDGQLEPTGVTAVVDGIADPRRRPMALQVVRRWVAEGKNVYALAAFAAQLGDTAIAVDVLKGLGARRDPRFWQGRVDPLFDPLRSEPHFQALWQWAGVPR